MLTFIYNESYAKLINNNNKIENVLMYKSRVLRSDALTGLNATLTQHKPEDNSKTRRPDY